MPLKPYFRAFDGWWYAQVRTGSKRRQVKLVKGKQNEQEAYRAFCRLMADEGKMPLVNHQQSVAVVCDLFLDHSQKVHTAETYDWHRRFLQDFCHQYGTVAVPDLKPFHVQRWLDAHPDWRGGRRHAISVLKRALNWAEEQGYITANPIRRFKKPPTGKRSRILSVAERQSILDAISDEPFRQFVLAMQETGCRPSEVAAITADQVCLENGTWVFERHKTAAKTGKPRVIYLTPRMLDLSKALIAKHPTGPLFRNRLGRAFDRNSIRCRFRRLRDRLPHLKHFTAYAYRHTFTTDALTNGVGVAQVAELLGHTSTDMVMRHYQHLSQQVSYMRAAAAQAVGARESSR